MPTAASNGVEICYETFGDPDDPTLLLIMGLGSQLLAWPEPFCEGLVDRGFHVVRFDNRDVGLSTWFDDHPVDVMEVIPKTMAGEPVEVPYLLSDMARDALGLLDALDVAQAHLVGASMGGMIAQTLALEAPERVLSLTSIMSTTGDPDVGHPKAEVIQAMLQPVPSDREGAIDHAVAVFELIGSPEHLDPALVRQRVEDSYDRAFHPVGIHRQLVAVAASPSRSDALKELSVPTLVVHGDLDPLVDVSGGRRTAEVVPGAELLLVEGMGHDLPPFYWPLVIEGITRTAIAGAAQGSVV